MYFLYFRVSMLAMILLCACVVRTVHLFSAQINPGPEHLLLTYKVRLHYLNQLICHSFVSIMVPSSPFFQEVDSKKGEKKEIHN